MGPTERKQNDRSPFRCPSNKKEEQSKQNTYPALLAEIDGNLIKNSKSTYTKNVCLELKTIYFWA